MSLDAIRVIISAFKSREGRKALEESHFEKGDLGKKEEGGGISPSFKGIGEEVSKGGGGEGRGTIFSPCEKSILPTTTTVPIAP